jgi:alpha-glucan,water dikinase
MHGILFHGVCGVLVSSRDANAKHFHGILLQVWASKWNERAYISTRKARIDHNDLCMAVLVQEIVRADYAFVIHTTNPSNEDPSEIYAEVGESTCLFCRIFPFLSLIRIAIAIVCSQIVKGLGETLVGAYAGRALSFVTKKTDIQNPQVSFWGEKLCK